MQDDRPGTPLDALIAELRRLPGIGSKSAQRLANHLLRVPREEARRLARSIEQALEHVHPCSVCHDLSDADPCAICRDPDRAPLLCVVEDPWAVRRVERTSAFKGRYHVLHGALSPLKGIGPDELHIDTLVARVAAGGIEEVILATSPTSEGEATAAHVADRLGGLHVRTTRIAYGLPVGSDLETVDEVTLGKALEGRREMVGPRDRPPDRRAPVGDGSS